MRSIFMLVLLIGAACAVGMETVTIAPARKGFVLNPSGDRYIPRGHN